MRKSAQEDKGDADARLQGIPRVIQTSRDGIQWDGGVVYGNDPGYGHKPDEEHRCKNR